jgi:5-(carboxyamino)imidazole ribonucleotide mutase
MIAANTTLPVIGVPIKTRTLNGVDSLLSIVQMPFGAPVATVSIGESGAKNAALLAAQILGVEDQSIQQKLLDLKHEQRVEAKNSEQQFD